MFSTFSKHCIAACSAMILSLFLQVQAQDISLRPVTNTYVLEDVNIVTAPGNTIENATLIIKDGLIHSLGTDIKIPVDAIPVEGDSLTVYAGFIDGMGQPGIKEPEDDNGRNDIDDPGNPPNEKAGITPSKTVREGLDHTEKSIDAMRKLGFTMAHVVPYGGMLPGRGSVILLGGQDNDALVFQENISLVSKLQGARRMYPSTVMGVMAKYREIYRNAELLKRDQQYYQANPGGMKRPSSDPVLESFIPAINGELPVMFEADDVKSVQRVLGLQQELGFRLMIAGIKQGWDVTDEVKAANVPVFLSLDLPEWKEEKKDSAEEEMSEENKVLMARKNEILEQHYTLPKAWSEDGIRFGFSSMGAKTSDIRGVLMTMKEKGVSEEVLLTGLTTGPASLLGLSRVAGTVEQGKLANLLITKGNYFDKESEVRYVFVEGKLYTYEGKDRKKENDSASSSVEGTWNYSVDTPDGKGTGQIILRKQGSGYTGNLRDSQTGNNYSLSDVMVDGSTVSFEFDYSDGVNQLPLRVNIQIDGESFSGLVDGGSVGTFPIEGSRQPEL